MVLLVALAVLWAIPATRQWATGRDEVALVSLFTFLAMATASVVAIRLSARIWQLGHTVFTTAFFVAFAALAFIGAGEELAWGEVVLDLFRNGTAAAARSQRGILQIGAMGEWAELIRLSFVALGVGAVFVTNKSRFYFFRVPMELLPWMAVIGAVSVLDIIAGALSLRSQFSDFLLRASELTEMMIAVVLVLYIRDRTRDMWFRIP